MIESPLIQEIVDKTRAEEKRKDAIMCLVERFGSVPPGIIASLESIDDYARLEELLKWSFRCPDLKSFRERVPA